MNSIKINLIIILSLGIQISTAQNLIFKSSFEEDVTMGVPYSDDPESGTWWQDLQGSDNGEFTWPITFWQSIGKFQVLVNASLPSEEYIQNTLVEVDDPNGDPTIALHQLIIDKDEGWTQDPYLMEGAVEDGDLYVKYLIKFEEDLLTRLGSDGWLTFFEWKTSGDYRIAAYVYEDLVDNIYWYVHGDNVANQEDPYLEYWYEENHDIAVPTGEWLSVEFFWHRSTGDDGRFWWAINGNVVADHFGPNKIAEPIDRIMLFTNYSSADSIGQWIDDIEIWDGFPCGEGIPCCTTVDTSISYTQSTIHANATSVSYQWVNCDNEWQPINGATQQDFAPTETGNYAVILDDGICSKLSECHSITVVGIKDNNAPITISIYPNPSTGIVTIEGEEIRLIKIINSLGEEVLEKSLTTGNRIDLSMLPKGEYTFVCFTENDRIIKKVVFE